MVSVRVHVRDSTCLKGFSRAASDLVLGEVVIPKVFGPTGKVNVNISDCGSVLNRWWEEIFT